jgi:regulator of sigma E protease
VQAGDQFLTVESTRVASAKHLRYLLGVRAGQPTHLTVWRNGQEVKLMVSPEYDPEEKAGRIGVRLGENFPYELTRPGPTPLQQFQNVLGKMAALVGALWHHEKTGIGPKDMSGPVGILGGFWYEITGGGFLRGMNLAVLLNINLAILNLLPFPILDGGHILLSILESIRRRPLNTRVLYATSMVFAALLISFMLYVTWFDLDRFVFWRFKSVRPHSTNEVISNTESNQP